MLGARPIPKALLPLSIAVRVPKDGTYGGEFEDEVIISHVRFERREQRAASSHSFDDGGTGRIYIDARNSDGAFGLPVGTRVRIGAESMTVVACAPIEVFRGVIHHWEVEVK